MGDLLPLFFSCFFYISMASWNLLPPNLAAAHDWHDPILRFHDPKACKLWHSRLRPGKKCRKKNEWFVYFQPGLSYSSHKLWDSAIAWLNIAVANPILTSQTKRMKHFNEQKEVTFRLYRRLDYQVRFLRYNASRFFFADCVTERLSAVIFGWWFCRFMQAKTADAKLFTSALGACSAGSCWAQASWFGVFFSEKLTHNMKNRAKATIQREVN